MKEVQEKSAFIFDFFKDAKGVESVSGMGLMIGIKTVKLAGEVLAKCMENGLLCLTAKDKIRLLPALNIPMDVLKEGLEILKKAAA